MAEYSGETMCEVPYRNKIYGHLYTKEEELEAEIKRLNKIIDKYRQEKIDNNLQRIQLLQANTLYNIVDSCIENERILQKRLDEIRR